MSTTLEKARNALRKNKKVDFGNRVELDPNNSTPVPCISTGSIVIDYMIGGNKLPSGESQCPGIPKGRITEIYGPEGSGKTTVALEAAVRVQRAGGTVCFLDYENAIAPAYARSLGIDFSQDKFDLFTPTTWEEGAEIIKIMADSKVDLIIVDSVSAMVPQATFEKDVSETGQIGLLARLQSSFLPNMVRPLRDGGTALVYLNQMRSRIKTSKYDGGPDEDTSGGRALKYYASLRVSLKRKAIEYSQVDNDLTGQNEKQAVCNIVRAQAVKNKVSPHQGHTTDFVIRYGHGIDQVRTLIDIAVHRKLIKKGGAWFTFFDSAGTEQRIQGKESLREFMVQNPTTFQSMVSELKSFSTVQGVKEAKDIEVPLEEPSKKAKTKEAKEKAAPPANPAVMKQVGDLIAQLDELGLLDHAGPWYKFLDENATERSFRGKNALTEFICDNPATFQFLVERASQVA